MFTRIAPRYDLMNRILSFGRDKAWCREAVRSTTLPTSGRLLDLAAGTGALAREARRQNQNITVVAVDFTLPMLRRGIQHQRADRILTCQADALTLPFPDGVFNAVVSGYLVRNVIDKTRLFHEMLRVVQPGGSIVCLDTSPPPPSPLRWFIRAYLRYAVPLLGWLIAGDRQAYTYLPESTHAFLTPEELAQAMRQAGSIRVRYRCFMCGTIAIHTGIRPDGKETARP